MRVKAARVAHLKMPLLMPSLCVFEEDGRREVRYFDEVEMRASAARVADLKTLLRMRSLCVFEEDGQLEVQLPCALFRRRFQKWA